MQLGWGGLGRVVSLTIVVTSAFWVVLGAWLYNSHLAADRAGRAGRNGSDARAAEPAPTPFPRSSGAVPVKAAGTRNPVAALIVPVSGVRADELVDTFTQSRAKGARRHDAIDIMAAAGTPVIAAASGKVARLFQSKDGGNTVYVRSPDRRTIYYYAHLSSYAPSLAEGKRLAAGDPIGRVGSTGNASPEAPHLHFAIMRTDPARPWYDDDNAINPFPLLTLHRR